MQPNPKPNLATKIIVTDSCQRGWHVAAYVDDTWLPTWMTHGCVHGWHVSAYLDGTWLPMWMTCGCLVDDTWLPTWMTHGCVHGWHVSAYLDSTWLPTWMLTWLPTWMMTWQWRHHYQGGPTRPTHHFSHFSSPFIQQSNSKNYSPKLIVTNFRPTNNSIKYMYVCMYICMYIFSHSESHQTDHIHLLI
jgi:hypothetical protein